MAQTPQAAATAAKVTGLPSDKIVVHAVGGGDLKRSTRGSARSEASGECWTR